MGLGGQAHTLEDELDMMEDDPKMYKILIDNNLDMI